MISVHCPFLLTLLFVVVVGMKVDIQQVDPGYSRRVAPGCKRLRDHCMPLRPRRAVVGYMLVVDNSFWL